MQSKKQFSIGTGPKIISKLDQFNVFSQIVNFGPCVGTVTRFILQITDYSLSIDNGPRNMLIFMGGLPEQYWFSEDVKIPPNTSDTGFYFSLSD